VAIARALFSEPQILLLDEPTSALDLGRSQTLINLLLDYQTQQSIPLVVSTHNLDFARQLATKLIYLEQGQIKAQHQEVANGCIPWDHIQQALKSSFSPRGEQWDI
jgi:D-methionine transport system ATP-binding protein